MSNLPFTIVGRLAGTKSEVVTFMAMSGATKLAAARYVPGNPKRRREVALEWADEPRLHNGNPLNATLIEAELHQAELRAITAFDERQVAPDAIANESEPEESSDEDHGGKRKSPSLAKILVDSIREDGAEFIQTPDGKLFAVIDSDGIRKCLSINSRDFKGYVFRESMRRLEKPPSRGQYEAIVDMAQAFALCSKPVEVSVRCAVKEDCTYIFLGDEQWRVVCVNADGWQVRSMSQCPVLFRRLRNMTALPIPERGGNIEQLRPFLPFPSGDEGARLFVLFVGFLVSALRGGSQHLVLVVRGEKGSGKSVLLRISRELVDPTTQPKRRPPREERDIASAVSNNYLIGYDNVSRIPREISDALASVVTGGGCAGRSLYTDDEEFVVGGSRPMMLNGITFDVESDLSDRAIMFELRRFEKFIDEDELWAGFSAVRASVLGVLLDGVARGYADFAATRASGEFRMASCVRFIESAMSAFDWDTGAFTEALRASLESGAHESVENSPVGAALVSFVSAGGDFEGSYGELLRTLDAVAGRTGKPGEPKPPHGWPRNGRGLSAAIKRIRADLNVNGVAVTTNSEGKRTTVWVSATATVGVNNAANTATPQGEPENRTGATENADSDDAALRRTAASCGVGAASPKTNAATENRIGATETAAFASVAASAASAASIPGDCREDTLI